MNWARPDLLALLLLVPLALLVVVYAERARWRNLTLLAALDVLPTLLPPRLRSIRTWQAVLAVVTTLALALAAAGPRLGFEWQQQKVEGISLVVVLDVSRSMDAQDVSPSRIERARREILDLVGLLRGDAVGLVIFAAGPYVRIPLTVDYDTFTWAVKDSSSLTIRAQGSALAGALDAASGLLEKAEGSGKAILLVSDGESHDDPATMDAALARVLAAGVRVYALGVGEPGGAPIPLEEGGFKKDASGDVVLSRLDEVVLQRLAAATGGAYVRAVASDEDVRALYETEIRGKLEASERSVRREKLPLERFQWPLGLALVSMSISAGIGIGRRRGGAARAARGGAAAGLLVALLFGASTDAWAGPAEDGKAALRAEQWEKAAELLGQARVENPRDAEATRGLAEALYRSGRVREAEQLFRTLAEQDPAHRAVHLYNAGNAAYRGGRLADALQDFRSAAQADPQFKPAQTNATAVERELAARTEPPPPESGEEQGEEQAGEQEEQASGEQQGQDGQAEGQEPPPGEEAQDQGKGGEPGEDPGKAGEDGQASEGPPPEGGPSGKPGTGSDVDDAGRREGTPLDGQGEPTDQEPGAEGEPALSSEGEDGVEATGEAEDGTPNGTGEMTREQAARLVDSVPDGTPRVVVGGRGTEKDW
ncbi:MAG: VWA domain-containing protein [Pseudomonadota bacterium]|nr:VWA domain-containing protein [Pseudomonadota bacterium]